MVPEDKKDSQVKVSQIMTLNLTRVARMILVLAPMTSNFRPTPLEYFGHDFLCQCSKCSIIPMGRWQRGVGDVALATGRWTAMSTTTTQVNIIFDNGVDRLIDHSFVSLSSEIINRAYLCFVSRVAETGTNHERIFRSTQTTEITTGMDG